MQAIIIYAAKAIIYSCIFFGYYCLALRNKRFHYYNRFYLLLTVALSLLLPFSHFELWQWNNSNAQVIQLLNVTGVNDEEAIITTSASSFSWISIATILYGTVALGLLLAIAFSVAAIFRFKSKYKVEKIESINFINTDLEQSPFSFFNNLFWKNTLSLTDEGGKQIFMHELTHIQQKHSLDKLLMRIITALFWFNPLYWLAQKELALIHEFIADEKAIENKSAEAFALMILRSQYAKSIFSPAQSFHYSPIKRRLVMLTTSKKPSFSYARRIMILPLLAATVLLFAFKLTKDGQSESVTHVNAPFVLVVDAGHGGTDNGAISMNGINEKDINLSIAKIVEKLAPEYGIVVRMTRTTDGTVSLQDRMNTIKSIHPDATISIHLNANGEQQTKKNEACVYIPRRETNPTYTQSRLLGSSLLQTVQKNFPINQDLLQRKSQGVYVIDANPYPAVVFECGYINNEEDVKALTDNAKMEQMARDILKGVAAYADADKNNASLSNNRSDSGIQSSPDTTAKPTPLYIVDGKEMSAEEVNNIDKNKIESINVLQGAEATKKYGDKGKNGVVLVTLKKQSLSTVNRDSNYTITPSNAVESKAVMYVDGKEISKEEMNKIPNDKIESIKVWKGDDAVKKYGEKGRNGVIEVTLKKEKSAKPDSSAVDNIKNGFEPE